MVPYKTSNVKNVPSRPAYVIRSLDDLADLVVALGIEGALSRAVAQRDADARAALARMRLSPARALDEDSVPILNRRGAA